jgi:DNA-binding CsgD family transcriptional regulator
LRPVFENDVLQAVTSITKEVGSSIDIEFAPGPTEREKMHDAGFPFRRFDVIDENHDVVLSGPSADALVPTFDRVLEPELAIEVRSLINERRFRNAMAFATTSGLIALDYGVRILERSDIAPGYYLICTERIVLRSPFERFVRRLDLSAHESTLARLLVGGYEPFAIALRLGTTPHDAERRTARLMLKAGVSNRRGFLTIVFPQVERRHIRRRSRTHSSAS